MTSNPPPPQVSQVPADAGVYDPMPSRMLRPINPIQARVHGWQPARDLAMLCQVNLLPAHVGEMGALVPNTPLALARLREDRYVFVMVCGFADGRNQLIDEQGRWVLNVLPMDLQIYPFALQPMAPAEEGAQPQFTLCFNHASGLYREAPDSDVGEQRFFTDGGEPQPTMQDVLGRLKRAMGQQQLTQRAVSALQQQNLLVPWQIQPREGHPGELLPQGLYRIDETRLNAQRGEALDTLHQAHALALAYAQLLSMSRINVLQRLKDVHAARRQQHAAMANPPTPDPSIVKQLFEPGQPDTLQFNW